MSTHYDPNYIEKKVYFEVGVKAILHDNNGNILLLKRSELVGGKWSLPGGGIDHGETALDAMAREIHEELGITVSDLEIRTTLVDWHPDDIQGVVMCYVGTAHDQTITLNWEHDEYVWVSPTAALEYQLTAHARKLLQEYSSETN